MGEKYLPVRNEPFHAGNQNWLGKERPALPAGNVSNRPETISIVARMSSYVLREQASYIRRPGRQDIFRNPTFSPHRTHKRNTGLIESPPAAALYRNHPADGGVGPAHLVGTMAKTL